MWDKGEPKRPDIRRSATFSEASIAQIDLNAKTDQSGSIEYFSICR